MKEKLKKIENRNQEQKGWLKAKSVKVAPDLPAMAQCPSVPLSQRGVSERGAPDQPSHPGFLSTVVFDPTGYWQSAEGVPP